MWVPRASDLDNLEKKIFQLKKEYDLFLSGRRRGEPIDLHAEIERNILKLTRFPFPSTAVKYRLKTLAHRFQAVGLQARNINDSRNSRRSREKNEKEGEPKDFLLWDENTLKDPKSMEEGVQRLRQQMAEKTKNPPPDVSTLKDKLARAVKSHLAEPGIKAIRFHVVNGDQGPRIRGELIRKE